MTNAQIDLLLTGAVYLVAIFVLFLIGKLVYDLLHRRYKLAVELFENDNFALSLAVVGYYLGLVFALGGALVGESDGLVNDLINIAIYGGLAIVLLNLSAFLNNAVVLPRFEMEKEIVDDQNAGTGAIEAGNHIANGLIIAGAITGEGGGIIATLVFWGLGQLVLLLAARLYNMTTSFDLHAELERDNVAVGVAFAGLLVGLGNLVREAITGDFTGWREDLTSFAIFIAAGLLVMPLVRIATDRLLVPGVKLPDELVGQNGEVPNVGAGALEAFSYIAASMLIGWAIL